MRSTRKSPAGDGSSEFPGSEITGEVLEFVRAMAAYQKKYRRRFPAWSEVLYVLRSLGYSKGRGHGEEDQAADRRGAVPVAEPDLQRVRGRDQG